jgi:triosephosphate isomerase
MTTPLRQKFVVANWKMHTTAFEAQQLAKGVVDGLGVADHVTVILCPPFPYLGIVGDMLKGSRVALGAQNMYPEADGAFTGEVSPTMLLDLGCKYVILGHSERLHKLGESDAFINEKVKCALVAGLGRNPVCGRDVRRSRSQADGRGARSSTFERIGWRSTPNLVSSKHRIRTRVGDRQWRTPCDPATGA